jgi:hypothetical protein
MGKVKDWLIGMQEDAMWMSRDSWAAKNGEQNLRLYDEIQDEMTEQRAPSPEMLQEQIDRIEEIFGGKE